MATQSGTPNTQQSTLDVDDLFFDDSMRLATHHIPNILPHERVFPVQLGSELFKLSGASISSDGVFPLSVTELEMASYYER